MATKQPSPIRINKISIENYKGIDNLEISFPKPKMLDDPDIFIMGSQNGLGKTSIIECCVMLILASLIDEGDASLRLRHREINIPDMLIMAGSKFARINGELEHDGQEFSSTITIESNGKSSFSNSRKKKLSNFLSHEELDDLMDSFIKSISGFDLNPLIFDKLLLFHGYRKVREGNPELGMMVDEDESYSSRRPNRFHHRMRSISSISTFKLQMLRSIMGQADFFEVSNRDKDNNKEIMNKLNSFVRTYAQGVIDVIRVAEDSTIDFRIKPIGKRKKSYTFDGLSSGQKEIIATTFLIWYYTRNNPCVVFIDEPELHLNIQWHRKFINSITDLAPQNQYIIATHSEDIMGSVDKDKRALLVSDNYKD